MARTKTDYLGSLRNEIKQIDWSKIENKELQKWVYFGRLILNKNEYEEQINKCEDKIKLLKKLQEGESAKMAELIKGLGAFGTQQETATNTDTATHIESVEGETETQQENE